MADDTFVAVLAVEYFGLRHVPLSLHRRGEDGRILPLLACCNGQAGQDDHGLLL